MQDKITDALRRNAVEEAVLQAREWAHLQPEDPQAHRWLAVASQQRGDHADAMRSIDRAIELAPQDDNLQLVRASLLIASRQLEEAGAALNLASGLNPNQFGAYLMQAQLALGRGDLVEEACDGGLIREDGKRLYPIREGIPAMLIPEGLSL